MGHLLFWLGFPSTSHATPSEFLLLILLYLTYFLTLESPAVHFWTSSFGIHIPSFGDFIQYYGSK